MADNKDKLTPEKLQQLQQLQQILMQQKGNPGMINQMPGGIPAPKALSKFTPKAMLIAILLSMQNSV
jgi:hypothetical protein